MVVSDRSDLALGLESPNGLEDGSIHGMHGLFAIFFELDDSTKPKMSIAESSASNRFEDPIQVIATTYLADFDESTDQITIVLETQNDKLSIEVYQGELLHLAANINSLQAHGF